MATIKVFSVDGVKELKCFDTLAKVPYLSDSEDEEIIDDGELTVGLPIDDGDSKHESNLVRQGY